MISYAFVGLALAATVSSPCPPEPPPGMIAEQTSFGGVIAPDRTAAKAGAAAGVQAVEAAKRFLGLTLPKFVIAEGVDESEPRGCDFVFPWRFSQFKAGKEPSTDLFAHEIGHVIFTRFLVADSRGDQYGGDAPDWLDEMAALAFEAGDEVHRRRAIAKYYGANKALIPLSKLLSMPHPEFDPQNTNIPAPGEVMKRPPISEDTLPFYVTVRALFDFLLQRTGDELVIRRLADQVKLDEPLDQWLLTYATPGQRLKDLTELDAELQIFVLTDATYSPAARSPSSTNP